MTAHALVLPYLRVSPVHIPRRDLVLASTDNLALAVSIVERDDPTAQALELTGGMGGPTLGMAIWRDTPSLAWDYGRPATSTGDILWSGNGTISATEIGTFDIAIPVGTFADLPLRAMYAIRLDFDGAASSVLLASGYLHIMPAFGPSPAEGAEAITTDALTPITTD